MGAACTRPAVDAPPHKPPPRLSQKLVQHPLELGVLVLGNECLNGEDEVRPACWLHCVYVWPPHSCPSCAAPSLQDGDRVSTLPVLRRKPRLRPPQRESRRRRAQPEVVGDLVWRGDSASTLTREQGEALRAQLQREGQLPVSPAPAQHSARGSARSPSLSSIFPGVASPPAAVRLDRRFDGTPPS